MKIGKLKIDLFYLLMIGILVLCFIGSVFLVNHANNKIKAAGGVKQIIIEVGKDVKDIVKEIETD
jgi:hypothetical protein